MAARPDVANGGKRLVEIVPFQAFGHAIAHGALFGIDDEFRDRAMHAGFVPASRMPDIVRAGQQHSHQRRRRFIAGLRIQRLGTAKGVGGAPRNAVMPRHLPDHEIHQADLGCAGHRCA